MNNLTKEIRKAIENNGGLKSFSSAQRRNRPLGMPMRRSMIKELDELTHEEVRIAFILGLIGNNGRKGSIVDNSHFHNERK